MKPGRIGIGILFLINPVIGVYDLLPDFIGCLLIIYGIRDVAYMIEKFDVSRRFFVYGAWVSVLRLALSFAGLEKHHTLPLTAAFVLAIVELIVYVPAIKNLFSGFDYAAMRHGGSKILSHGRKMGLYNDESGVRQYGEIQNDTTGRLAGSLIRFTVLRAVISVVPELPALQLAESENLGDVTVFSFSSIGTLIRAVCFAVVFVPSIAVFVKSVLFLRRVKKAEGFIPAVYAELNTRFGDLGELHTSSRMKMTALVFGGAVLLYMGFYDYQINTVPRFVPGLLLLAASVMLAVSAKGKSRLFALLPALFGVGTVPLSLRTWALQKDHYGLYKLQMMDMFDSGAEYIPDRNINEIDDEYLKMAFAESAEALVLGVGILVFALLYIRLCLKHTAQLGSVPERDRISTAKSLKIRGAFMLAGVILTALYFTAYRFILPYFDGASMAGIAVNILAVGLYAAYALQANQLVYGNNYEI